MFACTVLTSGLGKWERYNHSIHLSVSITNPDKVLPVRQPPTVVGKHPSKPDFSVMVLRAFHENRSLGWKVPVCGEVPRVEGAWQVSSLPLFLEAPS